MTALAPELAAPALPVRMPADRRRHGIGIVGAGGIVDAAHLPAYGEAGFRVEAIHDLDLDRARAVAARHGIPRVHAELADLLADPDIDVVDIAVPARAQPAIALAALEAGKDLLCQKPFAEDYGEAVAMVEAADRAGRTLAVNQNMRYSSAIAALRGLAARGWLGSPRNAEIQVNVRTEWHLYGEWLLPLERLEILYHSIHYFDALRTLLGDPRSVYCRGLRHPAQQVRGETWTTALLEYPDDRLGLVRIDHNALDDERDWFCRLRLDGSEGAARGTTWYLLEDAVEQEERLEYRSPALTGEAWVAPRLAGSGMPAAFAATMGELQSAIDDGREPPHSGRDNLVTMQLLHAAYRSMAEHRPVDLDEVAAEVPLGARA